jgi:uncharacterized protein with ParB-like and HNH nuclease domain
MKASETQIANFLSQAKTQFIIPVYQRNYDWSQEQCKQLLDDVLEVGKSQEINAHFVGSIVFVHDSIYTTSKIKKLTIVDGQQRLTTITLIYLVLYRLIKKLETEDNGLELSAAEILKTYLINEFAPKNEKLKLQPVENNKKALNSILMNEEGNFSGFSRLINNFNYFKTKITNDNYQTIVEGLTKLMFVEISLDRERDNPQRIFESLNSTGLELSQADSIRNYILMRLEPEEQDRIYYEYWKIIESCATQSNISKVSDFMRDYLTLKNKKIPNIKKVYFEFKAKYPISSLEETEKNLADIKKFAGYYKKLINTKTEQNQEIRLQLEYINRLEVNVAFPFLMQVYNDFAESVINQEEFIDILELVQSFVWRRFIVGLSTNSLNKVFMNLYDKVDPENYLFSIQKALLQKTGTQKFPKDIEVCDALKVKDVYSIKSKNTRYLLDRLENFENTEKVFIEGNNNITIEHIFPQNPSREWKTDLNDDEYNFIKENYLNTIANLTLSGNNGKLGNKPFKDKRDSEGGYKESRLWLNKHLATLEIWNKTEIENRFNIISKRFLQIWKCPPIQLEPEQETEEVNIFDAEDPKGKKLAYAIFRDKEINETKVTDLYVKVFQELFKEYSERFFTTDLKIGLTKNPAELKQPKPIDDTYSIESSFDNAGKFDRIKNALSIFDLEDELTIKYAN